MKGLKPSKLFKRKIHLDGAVSIFLILFMIVAFSAWSSGGSPGGGWERTLTEAISRLH